MSKILKNIIILLMAVCAQTALAQEYQDPPANGDGMDQELYGQFVDFTSDGLGYHISSTSPAEVLLMGETINVWPYYYEREPWYDYEEKWDGNLYSGDVVIPPTVEYDGVKYDVVGISYGTFTKCTGLTSITIPPTVRSIRPGAFFGCTALTEVKLPDGVALADDAFAGCSALKSIDLTYIGSYVYSRGSYRTFYLDGCTALDEIYLPLCRAESGYVVTWWSEEIPLTKVHAPWLDPEELEPLDCTIREDAVLYVPEGTKEKYAGQFPWDMFSKIIEEPARPGAGVKAPVAAPVDGAEAEYFTTAGVRAGAFASPAEAAAKLPAGIYICRSAAGSASKIIIR